MKNIRWVSIGLILILLLTACGAGEKKEVSKPEISNDIRGVSEDEILVGHIGPQTGAAAVYDLLRKGMESYFNYVNEQGGVDGRKLKLISYDDQYQPAQGVQHAKKLVEKDKVYAMLGNIGATSVGAYKEYLKENEMPLIFIGAAAIDFFNPPNEFLIGSGIMNYRLEAQVYLDYFVNNHDLKKLVIIYQDDDFGKEGYTAIKENINKYPEVEIVEELTFLPTDTEFSSQSQKIASSGADTVFYFGSPNPAASLKKELYKIKLNDVNFVVSSVANDDNLFDLAGVDVWEGTYGGAVFPNIEQSKDDEKVALFIERFSKDHPSEPLSGFAQYGWGIAQIFVEALERAEGDLSWDNLKKAFYSFDEWDGSLYQGITLSEQNHFGVTSMFMTQAVKGQIEPLTDTISVNPKTGEITYKE